MVEGDVSRMQLSLFKVEGDAKRGCDNVETKSVGEWASERVLRDGYYIDDKSGHNRLPKMW